MSTTMLAIYRGSSIASARLVAVSVDPALVADVAARLLGQPEEDGEDRVLVAQRRGERQALRLILGEAKDRR
jgi:hypothetical protein